MRIGGQKTHIAAAKALFEANQAGHLRCFTIGWRMTRVGDAPGVVLLAADVACPAQRMPLNEVVGATRKCGLVRATVQVAGRVGIGHDHGSRHGCSMVLRNQQRSTVVVAKALPHLLVVVTIVDGKVVTLPRVLHDGHKDVEVMVSVPYAYTDTLALSTFDVGAVAFGHAFE